LQVVALVGQDHLGGHERGGRRFLEKEQGHLQVLVDLHLVVPNRGQNGTVAVPVAAAHQLAKHAVDLSQTRAKEFRHDGNAARGHGVARDVLGLGFGQRLLAEEFSVGGAQGDGGGLGGAVHQGAENLPRVEAAPLEGRVLEPRHEAGVEQSLASGASRHL
jgi:hypothetical protein